MEGHTGALRLVARTLGQQIRPVPIVPFGDWLQSNIVLVDGPKSGELWSPDAAPYLLEIAECLSVEHPCNWVSVRKCQQSGVSILAMAWSLYLADMAPDNILYGVPGKEMMEDANSLKLQPLIDAWQNHTGSRTILPTVSRSGRGSTTYEKKFHGGSLILANSNVVNDLSGKTIRYGVKDEVSKWNNTPNGDDPEELFFGRFTSFRREKSFKIFQLSTPELDSGDELGELPGHCRIDRAFIQSDRRFWCIKCPECDHEFSQIFGELEINRDHPHRTIYGCPNCAHMISEAERVVGVRGGRYVPTFVGTKREPGFHIDAFVSLMMSYEAIAEDFLSAEKKGESGKKNFTNLVLAKTYTMRGNAPDHKRLMERRERFPRGQIPEQGLILVAAGDIQHNGIYVEVVAFAQDRQNWCVEALFLEGGTDQVNHGAWAKLDEVYHRMFPDAFGGERRIEAMAVDAGDGNRMNQVLEWCRQRPDTYAIRGKHGRGVPAIGVPSKQSINRRGKRTRVGGAMIWPVGTWTLKADFMGALHKHGIAAGEDYDPPGYCHYAEWVDEEYFKQVTAEYFSQEMINGRFKEEWKSIRKDNHFLDCRVYLMAMAEHLGLTRMSPSEWASLRKRRYPSITLDLLASDSQKIMTTTPVKKPLPALNGKPDDNIARIKEAWKRRH